MNYGMVLAATAVMALVTYLPRMLPMGRSSAAITAI